MVIKRKKIKASGLPEFDPAEYLDSDEAVAEYLTAVLSENDPVPSPDSTPCRASALHSACGWSLNPYPELIRIVGRSRLSKRSFANRRVRPGAGRRASTPKQTSAALLRPGGSKGEAV
jgi:hypothetical protein